MVAVAVAAERVMPPILTPREAMEAYEEARESVRIYEAARASARAKTMSVRVVEGILWGSTATLIAFVLAFAAQALGIYPI
jgi:hypothetical protein